MTSSSPSLSSFRSSSCPSSRNFRDDDDRRPEVQRRPEIQPEVEVAALRHDLDEAAAVQITAAAGSNSDAAAAVVLGTAVAEVDGCNAVAAAAAAEPSLCWPPGRFCLHSCSHF